MENFICGIDENGFGPLMGPLVITGILTEINISLPEYIKDSKSIYKKREDFKKIEEISILLFYLVENRLPEKPDEILRKFASIPTCETKENICYKNIPKNFETENIELLLFKYRDFLKNKNKIRKVKSEVVCCYNLNNFVSHNRNKFVLNILNFTKIMHQMKEFKNVIFYCGKIGGYNHYSNFLRYFFPDCQIKILDEKEEISSYILKGENLIFEIGFYKNVEKISPVASLSSILGKYIRELIMKSILKSLNLENISGYRDKKTINSIKKIKFSDFLKDCIIRNC